MKHIIAKGRQMGKSSLMDMMIQQQASAIQKSIDQMIIDDIWGLKKYQLHKSWRDRRGRKMHRIGVNDEIYEWLSTQHNQYGTSNPEWWRFENKINITDRLYLMLILKWGDGY